MERKTRTIIDWSLWDKKLGQETDKAIAAEIGCTVGAITMRRKKLGISPSGKRVGKIDWSEFDLLLGTMEDKVLAKKMGCSVASVLGRRKKLGVASFNPRKSVNWDEWDEFIPEMSDTQLAKKIGCAPGSVKVRRAKLGLEKYDVDLRKKVDWKRWESKIGTVDDKDLALMIGCTVGAIKAQRKKLNIGILSEKEKVQRASSGSGDIWSQWDHMLGKCPDDVLAEQMGITRSKVAVRRMRLMIANYPLDWNEGDKPCLGGCGKTAQPGASTCGGGKCEAKFAEL